MIGWTDSQHSKPSKLLLRLALAPISGLQDPVSQTRWRGTTAVNQAQNSVLFTTNKSNPSAQSSTHPSFSHFLFLALAVHSCTFTSILNTQVHRYFGFNISITFSNCVIKESIAGEVVSTVRVTTHRAQSTDHQSITQLKHSNHKGKKV